MKVKRMVKRLLAVGTGVTMLGATAMGALAAADLSNYPDMFVSDGTFNGFLVVGEAAKPIDNLAMTDIVGSMKYKKAAETATTVVEGDAWKVGTSTKKLEMTETNGSYRGEQIYDIEQWIGKDELEALADGTFTTNAGKYGYTQYLYFDTKNKDNNEIVAYRENDKDVTADFFFVKSGGNIGEYKLEFTSTPESTIQDTAGAAATAGPVLDDFENTKINFFGQDYDVVLARRVTDSSSANYDDGIKLTLMGGATSGSLLEGESQTFELSEESYEVSLTYTDSTYAKFTVNGEATNKLQVGDTYKLAGGKEIGVSELLYQSYAGGVHSAKFFLGASKVELRDNDITDTDTSNEMVVGSETINGAAVIVTGSDDNSTFRLTGIRVNMTAQDDYFVPVNGKLSDAILEQNDEKELLFTNNWDMEYKGLEVAETHEIKLYSSTDRKYKLQFYDGDGNQVDMPLYYANDISNVQYTEDGEKEITLNEGQNISKNDYFVITQGDPTAGSAKTFVLQYKGADKSTATSPKIQLKNLGSGETLEYAVETSTTSNAVATIKLGGYSWGVQNVTAKTASDFDIAVDLDGDAVDASDAPGGLYERSQAITLVDYYGMNISMNSTAGCFEPLVRYNFTDKMTFTTVNTNDYDNQAPHAVSLVVTGTTGTEVTFSSLQVGGQTQALLTPEGEENIAYGYNSMGGKFTYKTPSGSPAEFVYEYPKAQRLPQLYVTSGAVTSSTDASGDLTSVNFVDATKLDSEIADAKAQHLIVVGGPCVNTVAAELMGNPTDCAAGFTPGKARIKLFEQTNGNVAMLVAGYSGADTRLAGKVIANRWAELSGDEVEVEGTTYADATIGAPTAVTTTEEAATEETTATE